MAEEKENQITNGKRTRKRTAKGKALEEENGNKELEIIHKEKQISNKADDSENNQGDKQAPVKRKKKSQQPKRSAEIEAAQLRAAQFFKTLENTVSAGDKPTAVTINDNDITCAENTQKERTWNANVQLTPITNEQRTPATYNVQRSPNNMQQTPITKDVQQTPIVQRDTMDSPNTAKQNDTSQTSLTELVGEVEKGPQNNETPRTYQTPTLTNAVTPIVLSVPLATVSRRPKDMTQADNATQQPQINVRDRVNETIPSPQTNRRILSHQSTHLVQEDMTMGGQTRTDATELGLGARGRENQIHNSVLCCGKPKSATRLFGTQAASYTDLLA